MDKITVKQLLGAIKDVYLNLDAYVMEKIVPEFHHNGEFLGDYFNYIIFEPLQDFAPRIYHTASPFDVVSKKAPQQALVFQDGNLLLNIDFTEYVDMRTGVMDAILLQSLGFQNISDKKLMFFGTGKIARWSLRYLKETYPELMNIDFQNASGEIDSFIEFTEEIGVAANYRKNPKIADYDVIILHTNSSVPILTAADVSSVKDGAVITSYRTTSDKGELAYEFLNSNSVRFITDWEHSLDFVEDIKAAIDKGILQRDKVEYLADIFENRDVQQQNSNKRYTVFRSTGTPMQNVAVLKLLLERNTTKK